MADEIELTENRTFPAPPPFYKSFSKKNLDALKDLRSAAALQDVTDTLDTPRRESELLQSLQVQDELRYLIPPVPPEEDEKYRVFTETQDISGEHPSLASNEIEQLFPSPTIIPSSQTDTEWTVDRVYYLKKLVRSIMLNFLELIGTLASDSSQWQEKFESLRVLFYNAHSLVNEYRGHQARETLILMMERQLEEKKREVAEIGRLKGKVGEILSGLQKDAPLTSEGGEQQVNGTVNGAHASVDQRKKEQRILWQALDEELGT